MLAEIEQQLTQITQLCRQYRVQRLDLFGSAARGTFAPETSDFDFVARFADTRAIDYADRYLDFAEALERLLRRKVDVVTERAIRNPYFRAEIAQTRQVVYEERPEQTPA